MSHARENQQSKGQAHSQLEKEINSLEDQLRRARLTGEDLKKQLDDKMYHERQLETQIAAKQDELSRAKARNNALDIDTLDLQNKIAAEDGLVNNLREELDSLERRNEDLDHALARERDR